MEDETNIAANEFDVATEQTTEVTQETTNEIEQSTSEVSIPDVTTTKAFSERLKETNQKSIDAEYSKLFGQHGIHTKADYDRAIAEQDKEAERARIQEETGVDPDTLQSTFEKLKENDPDFQELKTIRAEKNIAAALTDLNNELKDCGIDLQLKDLSAAEVAKIPNADKVTELVQKGKTLAEAVFLANKKDFFAKQAATAQQDTIKKIAANGASSPGSLSSGAVTEPLTESEVDKMTPQELSKRWKEVRQLYKMR